VAGLAGKQIPPAFPAVAPLHFQFPWSARGFHPTFAFVLGQRWWELSLSNWADDSAPHHNGGNNRVLKQTGDFPGVNSQR